MNSILIVTVLFAVVFIFAGLFITKIRIWKPKRTFWLAAVYLISGFMAFLYLLFMSDNIEKVSSDLFLQQQIEENEQLTADLKVQKFDSLKEEHLKFTKTFEVTAENIEILRNENSYYLPVVISWIDSDENKIDVSYYETPIYLSRVYITPFVVAPRVEWSENKLYIVETETTVNAKSMQFSTDLLGSEELHHSNDPLNELIGQRILHLNVPKQFNIIDKDGWY